MTLAETKRLTMKKWVENNRERVNAYQLEYKKSVPSKTKSNYVLKHYYFKKECIRLRSILIDTL